GVELNVEEQRVGPVLMIIALNVRLSRTVDASRVGRSIRGRHSVACDESLYAGFRRPDQSDVHRTRSLPEDHLRTVSDDYGRWMSRGIHNLGMSGLRDGIRHQQVARLDLHRRFGG